MEPNHQIVVDLDGSSERRSQVQRFLEKARRQSHRAINLRPHFSRSSRRPLKK